VNNQQSQEQQDPKPTIYLDCLKPNQCLARKICDKKNSKEKSPDDLARREWGRGRNWVPNPSIKAAGVKYKERWVDTTRKHRRPRKGEILPIREFESLETNSSSSAPHDSSQASGNKRLKII
jgi:hypothetical protein